jgi:hypothetical protein
MDHGLSGAKLASPVVTAKGLVPALALINYRLWRCRTAASNGRLPRTARSRGPYPRLCRSVVMSGSSESDSQGGQGVGVGGIVKGVVDGPLSNWAPARTTRPGGTRLTTPVISSASRARVRLVVRPQRTKEKGKEVTHSLPHSMYTAPGGLRQDRGRAAQSTVRGQNPTDGGGEMMQGHAVVIAGRGPTGLVLAGERPFARGR